MDRELQILLRSGLEFTPDEAARAGEQLADGVMERLILLDLPARGLLLDALSGAADLPDGPADSGVVDSGLVDSMADDVMRALLLAPAPDRAAADRGGEDSADRMFSSLLRSGLAGEADEDIADGVMAALNSPSFPLLREALTGEVGADGVADDVMAALGLSVMPQVGEALREVAASSPADLSGDVMAALPAGEGALLRAALAGPVDLSGDVMDALPMSGLGELLRAGLTGTWSGSASDSASDAEEMAEGVMAGLPQAARPRPALRLLYGGAHRRGEAARAPAPAAMPAPEAPAGWRSWRPMIPVVVAIAALMLLVLRIVVPPGVQVDPLSEAFALSELNTADVEDVEAWTASVQVMQFEENGVTFILIDEGEPSPQPVPM